MLTVVTSAVTLFSTILSTQFTRFSDASFGGVYIWLPKKKRVALQFSPFSLQNSFPFYKTADSISVFSLAIVQLRTLVKASLKFVKRLRPGSGSRERKSCPIHVFAILIHLQCKSIRCSWSSTLHTLLTIHSELSHLPVKQASKAAIRENIHKGGKILFPQN